MAKFQLLPGETLIGGGHMTYWHERYNYSGKSDSLAPPCPPGLGIHQSLCHQPAGVLRPLPHRDGIF